MENAGVDKGSVEGDISNSDNQIEDNSSDSIGIDSIRRKRVVDSETMFKKLKKNPTARANLASIHSARSHKYGHVQFGPKNWYKESGHKRTEENSAKV